MKLDTARLRKSTQSLLALLLSAGSLFQVKEVHDWLILQAHDHPHVIGLIGTLTGLFMLLHNPEVAAALGIKTTVTTEAVEVAPEATVRNGL